MPREPETMYLLTVNMAGNKGEVIPQSWICRTQQAALDMLAVWVDEQNAGYLDPDELVELPESAGDRIQQYFVTSEDTYDIDELQVVEENYVA